MGTLWRSESNALRRAAPEPAFVRCSVRARPSSSGGFGSAVSQVSFKSTRTAKRWHCLLTFRQLTSKHSLIVGD